MFRACSAVSGCAACRGDDRRRLASAGRTVRRPGPGTRAMPAARRRASRDAEDVSRAADGGTAASRRYFKTMGVGYSRLAGCAETHARAAARAAPGDGGRRCRARRDKGRLGEARRAPRGKCRPGRPGMPGTRARHASPDHLQSPSGGAAALRLQRPAGPSNRVAQRGLIRPLHHSHKPPRPAASALPAVRRRAPPVPPALVRVPTRGGCAGRRR